MNAQTTKKYFVLLMIFLLSAPLYLWSGSSRPDSLKEPERIFENYGFSGKTPVDRRIKKSPPFVLTYLKNLDGRDDYSDHELTPEELEIIKKSIELLPAGTRRTMEERLLGIYFINNFLGSGFADWVLDKENNFYVFLVFNPVVLKKNISQTITDKEKTCFIPNDPSYEIYLDCGTELSGFYYILLHETAHLVDYVSQVTPYTEEEVKIYKNIIKPSTPFISGVWKTYNKTIEEYTFRKEVTFYGFHKGPRINISRAPEIYRALSMTPLPTLYGTLNWAEDIAEMLTFYHITEKLKYPFIIKVLKNGKEIYRLEPMKNPHIRKRLRHLEIFYR